MFIVTKKLEHISILRKWSRISKNIYLLLSR